MPWVRRPRDARPPRAEPLELRLCFTSVFGANLINNPGAESGAGSFNGDDLEPVPGWTTQGVATVVQNGVKGTFLPGPPDGGNNFFAGGNDATFSAFFQTIDVSAAASDLDNGTVKATLSGYLGGWQDQDDNAVLTATFEAADRSVLGTLSIGPVLAADRKYETALLFRSIRGAVPAGTRRIDLALKMTRQEGSYDDGYADNLSLILTKGDPRIVTGCDAGSVPEVRVFDGATGSELTRFDAFDAKFGGGVRVATGDVTGDGVADIVAGAGKGGRTSVRVFDGLTDNAVPGLLGNFYPFGAKYNGGVNVAAGDVNGDGLADVIVSATGKAGPRVEVFDGASGNMLANFLALAPKFKGGVTLAAGDVDGDGLADVIAGTGPGATPLVQVFSGADFSPIRSFYAFDPSFKGGVYVAAGDLNGDGKSDVCVSAGSGTPAVKVFDLATGTALLTTLTPEDARFLGGIRTAVMDVNADGHEDILTVTGKGSSHLQAFDGESHAVLDNLLAYEKRTGAFVSGG